MSTLWFTLILGPSISGLLKERPMVIDSLNLNLSLISSFLHIYGFMDLNIFVDLCKDKANKSTV